MDELKETIIKFQKDRNWKQFHTPENLAKKQELWNYVKAKDKEVYKMLRYSMLGFSVNLPGKSGRWISKTGYKVMNKWIGFN